MSEYTVGQIVRLLPWDVLVTTYELDSDGDIKGPNLTCVTGSTYSKLKAYSNLVFTVQCSGKTLLQSNCPGSFNNGLWFPKWAVDSNFKVPLLRRHNE